MKFKLLIFLVLTSYAVFGQSQTKRVLFLGNSYTDVNNLPQMCIDLALSAGDTLITDKNTPGGYTFEGHSTNTTSLSKIALGNWDYVVLQEQSQRPSFPISQVETDVFPFAQILDSLVHAQNECAETVFYMTWGRKNGDASNCPTWPPVCTYSGMDSLLNLRYRTMADENDAVLSPVGAVWKYIRENYPSIDLYAGDESHPSVAGTYAAACCFYSTLFRKDPSNITSNSTLSASDATDIRSAAKLIVYDNLSEWHIGEYDASANFDFSITGTNEITFQNSSSNATEFLWDFGDGDTSTQENPVHTYAMNGSYTASLQSSRCGVSDTFVQTISTDGTGLNFLESESTFSIYPNPISTSLHVDGNFQSAASYRIDDLLGREFLSGSLDSKSAPICVESLADGIYFLQLFNRKKLQGPFKFVKIGL